MPYPDQLLTDDEHVVRHLHPHWLTLVAPVVVFLGTVGAGAFLLAVVPVGGAQPWLRLVIGVAGVVLLAWFVLVPFLRWKTTHYVITTDRVLIRTGVLRHVGRDIPLQRINDVAFEQSLFDRIIGAGTLQVESAGETGQTVLRNIPHSDDVQQLINRLVEEDSRRTAGYGHSDGPPDGDDTRTRRLR
ncbi:MAG: PH domain-containing protein [Actinobacteria bacterium]|nr:PH domain-containing protein [Actinomycetota bacterium]MBI3687884.1 PH domain-containing protein [Actinomycetota bacterium]